MAKNVDKALEAVQLDINKEYGDCLLYTSPSPRD